MKSQTSLDVFGMQKRYGPLYYMLFSEKGFRNAVL